jgi:hypothetical protein
MEDLRWMKKHLFVRSAVKKKTVKLTAAYGEFELRRDKMEKEKREKIIYCDCCGKIVTEDDLRTLVKREDVHPGAATVTLNGHENHWITIKREN